MEALDGVRTEDGGSSGAHYYLGKGFIMCYNSSMVGTLKKKISGDGSLRGRGGSIPLTD